MPGQNRARQQSGLSGMRAFTFISVGQFLSLLGSGMTRFAITLWAWELTGQATALSLAAFFSFAPSVIMTPIAGALVDRWYRQRKLVMMLSDVTAGLATIALLLLATADTLEIWHIYAAGAFAAVFESFQWPAYSAAITTMVDKEHYGRTSAIMGLAGSASGILAPVFGVAVYAALRLEGVLLIDVITFLFAVGSLALVRIPVLDATAVSSEGKGSLISEAIYGFRYILKRRSLLGLQLVFFFGNMISTLAFVLLAPMILARTGNNEGILSLVTAMAGVGSLIGGLVISVWGGPKRRVYGVLFGWFLSGLFGTVVLGIGQGLVVWLLGALAASLFIAPVNASNQAIWQSKVPAELQGRVFSARFLIAQISTPLSMLIAGPLADVIFEPAMQPDGAWAGTFGWLVGVGPGAGIGLLFIICGVLVSLVALAGYLTPAVRNVEDIIPDLGPAAPTAAEPETSLEAEPEPTSV
jgi:MFS transporter, DHA3 family, macrolide efflux protein